MGWYRLKLSGLKSSKIRILMENFKTIEEIFNETLDTLKEKFNFNKKDIEIILDSKESDEYIKFIEYLKNKNIGLIDLNDSRYSEYLRNIEVPPLFIFFKGNINLLSSEKILTVVGTRRATQYGRSCTEKIVSELVDEGVTIVSGLAVGIDKVAHKKTLEKNGKTIAVLGCAIDLNYPIENQNLRKEIEEKGLVLSEFSLGIKAKPENFPIRNRILAGLSRGVLVVESCEKGGSLITANLAFEEGRDVFAVPGEITAITSAGCNNLIRDSIAKLVSSGEDIIKEYFWKKKEKKNEYIKKIDVKLKICDTLKVQMNLYDLKDKIKIEIKELLECLIELEKEGLIRSLAGGNYIKLR